MIQMTDLQSIVTASAGSGKTETRQDDFQQASAWERGVQALLEKLPEDEEEEKKGGFWTQRAQSQEEFMEMQQKAAARQRMLMKLRLNGGHISPAEVLMGLL